MQYTITILRFHQGLARCARWPGVHRARRACQSSV